ncbi:MAG TPA: aminotransferase class V-fold PLP-dependent enzyme, partial [Myxococcota bacterium]
MLLGSTSVGDALGDYEAARGVFAQLVGAATHDVSFFQTCAAAISQAAHGVPLARGDEVLISDEEYPSNAYPWYRAAERAGASVVAVPVAQLEEAARTRERVRVIAVSWVQFSTGKSVDLRALADAVHARDGWLVVDAIQGLGIIPFAMSESGADVVCGGTHKWCLGPLGHGFMACAPGRASAMQPLVHGAMTYGTSDDAVDPKKDARTDPRRFEPGAPLLVGAIGGAAAISLLLEIGIPRVHQEAMAMAALVRAGARARGLDVVVPSGPAAGPITAIIPRHKTGKEIVDAMRARKCSVAPRGGGVRVAPHVHNGPQHIERFFALWDEIDRA